MKYVLGLSGGVDSCYALHLCRDLDVTAVTFSNGWDTLIAQENVSAMCSKLEIKHKTYTCDLDEYHEIQRAFLLSGTMHAECPSDVAIKKTLLDALDEFDGDKIITGGNKLEGNPSPEWSVVDGLYVKDVMKKHGRVKLKTFPNLRLWDHYRYNKLVWRVLDDYDLVFFQSTCPIDYNPAEAKKLLKNRYGWQDYGHKHHENTYTKFNQGLRYFKYGVDMREVEVDADISEPPMETKEFITLGNQICKELDLDLNKVMNLRKQDWKKYRSYRKYLQWIR